MVLHTATRCRRAVRLDGEGGKKVSSAYIDGELSERDIDLDSDSADEGNHDHAEFVSAREGGGEKSAGSHFQTFIRLQRYSQNMAATRINKVVDPAEFIHGVSIADKFSPSNKESLNVTDVQQKEQEEIEALLQKLETARQKILTLEASLADTSKAHVEEE